MLRIPPGGRWVGGERKGGEEGDGFEGLFAGGEDF